MTRKVSLEMKDSMADVREAFRTLQGSEFDARSFEDAVAALRYTHQASLSAEYTVERLMWFADQAGWIKAVKDKPPTIMVVVK